MNNYKNLNLLHIITDLAGRFIKITFHEIDREINNTLKTIGELTEVDSCYIYIYSDDLKFFECEYKWNKDGIYIEELTGKPTEPYEWSIEQLKKLDPVIVNYPVELPDKAEGEHRFWERISLKSSLVIPFSYQGKLKGCIAFRTIKKAKQWNEEDIELLKLLGEIIAGVFERKKTEGELGKYKNNLEDMIKKEKDERLKTESILSASFNAINDLISVIDRNMNIVMSNWKGFEYIPEHIRQKNPLCYEIFANSCRPCAHCHTKKLFETNNNEQREYIKVINGRTMEIRLFPVMEDNNITIVVQTMRDISEKQNMEKESILLRRAVENTKDCIIIRDIDGTIHYVNSAFEAITGYKMEEILGKKIDLSSLCVKEDSNLYEIIMNTIKKGEQKSGRVKLRHKEGNIYEIEYSASPLTDGNGDITGYISIFRDITEKIKIEHQLRQSQKMESVGTLAGGIAHDFNNILGAIIINAEIAIDDVPDDSSVKKNLEQILSSSNRAAELVKQILTFSRQHEEEKKTGRNKPYR